MQREKVYSDFQKIEYNILRFRGRSTKTLSPVDKDALIAALSTMIIASERGYRPSATVLSLVNDFGNGADRNR